MTDIELATLSNHLGDTEVAIDTGSATWASCRNNRNYDRDVDMINSLYSLGYNVKWVGLQSVLSKTYNCAGYTELGGDDRVDDILSYFEQIQTEFPDIKVGVVDALPAKVDTYRETYTNLVDTLRDEGFNLAFIHLDIPVSYPRNNIRDITYTSLTELSKFVQEGLGIQFGMFIVSNVGGKKGGYEVAYHKTNGMIALLRAGMNPDMWISSGWYPYPQYSASGFYSYKLLKIIETHKDAWRR